MKKLTVLDYTLSSIETGENPLLFREKTAISSMLDSCGADVILLPPLKKLREDTVIYRTIAGIVKRAAVSVSCSAEEELEKAYESISQAVCPVLTVSLPVSTVQMEYLFHIKQSAMPARIGALVSRAAELCDRVIFAAEDASRSDRAFLREACAAAQDAGASAVLLCDTAGVFSPDEIGALVRDVLPFVEIPVYVRVSDALHMAAACALSAISAGADGVCCAASGRDVLPTGDLSDLIAVRGGAMGVESGLDSTKIHRDILKVLRSSPEQAKPASEGGRCDDIFLDGDSSLPDVGAASSALGYELSEEDLGKVHTALRAIASKKGTIGARELEALIASYAMQVPSTYHVIGYNASCSNITSSMAHVVLQRDGEDLSGVATGDGPIDAAFRAIEQIVGFHYELDDFQIRAVTEGKEALGEALVRLRSGGRLYSGSGISTDIVGSSIRAYVNALNKIVAGEA